jgi:hypothetical protein
MIKTLLIQLFCVDAAKPGSKRPAAVNTGQSLPAEYQTLPEFNGRNVKKDR